MGGVRFIAGGGERAFTLDQGDQHLATGQAIMTNALGLLGDDHATLSQRHGETVRALLNRALLPRLYIDADEVTGRERAEPFAAPE